MNPSEFLAITCNLLKVREKSLVQGASGFGFGFASHWMKNWCEIFKPISKRSSRIFTFENHLKTAPWRIISGGCLFNLQMWNDFWSEWSPHQAILVSNSSGWKEVGKKYRLDQRVESMTVIFLHNAKPNIFRHLHFKIASVSKATQLMRIGWASDLIFWFWPIINGNCWITVGNQRKISWFRQG